MNDKEKLQAAYNLLDEALQSEGGWETIVAQYECAMVDVMEILNELLKR